MPTGYKYTWEYFEGKTFGNLTPICMAEPKNGDARVNCKCLCGKEYITYAYGLFHGTSSCGCKSPMKKFMKEQRYTPEGRKHEIPPSLLRHNLPMKPPGK
jgi:hypothetical protein